MSDSRKIPIGLALAVGLGVAALAGAGLAALPWPWSFLGDNKVIQLPGTFAAWEAFRAGRLPEWTGGMFAGFPLITEPIVASLYAPHLASMAVATDPLRGYDVTIALHLGLRAAGSVYFLSALGLGRSAVVGGAILSVLSPFLHWWAFSILPPFIAGCWWPWLLGAAEHLRRADASPVGRHMWLGWLAVAGQVMAGYPEFAFYTGGIAALWLLRPGELGLPRSLGRVTLLGVGGVFLCLPQVAPSAAMLAESTRGTPPNAALGRLLALSPTELTRAFWSFGPTGRWPAFVGVGTLGVAIAALTRPRPGAAFLAGVVLVTGILALGDHTPIYGAVHAIPPFHIFRGSAKLWTLTESALLWLSAMGIQAALDRTAGPNRRTARLALLALVGLVFAERLVWSAAQLSSFEQSRSRLPHRHESVFAQSRRSGMVEKAAATTPPARVVSVVQPRVNYGASGMVLGLESLSGGPAQLVNGDVLRMVTQPLTRRLADRFGLRFALVGRRPCAEVAKALEFETAWADDEVCLLEHPAAPPRYEFLRTAHPVATVEEGVEAAISGEAPSEPIVWPGTPRELEARLAARGAVAVSSYVPGDVVLDVDVDRDALLLVRESWAPGWEAQIDDVSRTIHRASGTLFAVEIPKGTHRLHLRYTTPWLRGALALSAAWVLGALAAAFLRRRSIPG